MNFYQSLYETDFSITVELTPPKGTDVSQLLSEARALAPLVNAFNLTDNQRAVMHASPISACAVLERCGLNSIIQMTCRDRNVLALQSDILSASILGIQNILVVSGDYPHKGDHPTARPVFDLDSVQLIALIKKLEAGMDFNGNPLTGTPRFLIGAVTNPGIEPFEPQLIKLLKKIEAGAQFIQTQLIYDLDLYDRFIALIPHDYLKRVKILAGVFPLKSLKQAHFLNSKVPGVHIPDAIFKRLESAVDPQKEGQEITRELLNRLRGKANGVHIMAMGQTETIKAILAK